MEIFSENIIVLILTLLVLVFVRELISEFIFNFLKKWHARIKKFVEDEKDTLDYKEVKGEVRGKVKECFDRKFGESLIQAQLIEKRGSKKGLGFITEWVSRIEFLVFGFLTVVLFFEGHTLLSLGGVKIFGAFLGGWLGIKVLSNYGVWSDSIVGKAYYHTSLLGALMNIAAGTLAGYLLYLTLSLCLV